MCLAGLFLAISESFLGALGLRSHPSYPHCPSHTHTLLFPQLPPSRGNVLLRVPSSHSAFPGGSMLAKASVTFTYGSLITSRLLLRLLPASGSSQFPDLKALNSPGLYLNLPAWLSLRSGCLWLLASSQAQVQPSLVRNNLSRAPVCSLSWMLRPSLFS